MEHVIVFYNFFTLAIGIAFLIIFFYIAQKGSDTRTKSFIFFYSSFTIISIIELIATYVRTNCYPEEVKFYEVIRYLGNPVGLVFLLFTLPFFIHNLVEAKRIKNKNIFFGVTTISLLIINYSISLFSNSEATNYLRIISKDFILIAIILYCFLQIVLYYKKLTDSEEKAFFIKLIFLFGLFIPGIITDTFLTSFPTPKIFPLIYIATGFLFLRYFYNSINTNSNLSAIQLSEIPRNALENQFGLTSREIEIIKFLAGGFTNNKIAEELFISVNTVKSHIRNSYQKLGVANRIELIKLFNSLQKNEHT